MCWSVLKCVAGCCSVLQCGCRDIAVWMQCDPAKEMCTCVGVRWSALQCVAGCCSVAAVWLQCDPA